MAILNPLSRLPLLRIKLKFFKFQEQSCPKTKASWILRDLYFGRLFKTGKAKNIHRQRQCKIRVSQHDKNKDFWNVIFAIKLNDNGFDDAQNSYLEHYFIKKATDIEMSTLVENKQIPKCPKLSAPALSDLQHYINTIEILLSTLGLKCFQIMETQSESVFVCKDKYGNIGEGEYLEDGFHVI